MPNETELPEEHLNAFEHYFFLTNGWIGTVLNVLVLFIALRHADTHDKPRQIIVINMTFADLLTCIVYMLTRPRLNRFPEFLCYPYYICIMTSQICSCVNLLWLNVDKLIYIKFPLHYYQLVRRRRVLILTFFTWFFLILLAIAAYGNMTIMHACNYIGINPFMYLAIIIIYVLVISLSFIISAVIYCIAHNFRRTEPQAQSRIFQRLFFLFSSTMWTFATCLPYRILYLVVNWIFPASCYNVKDEANRPFFCDLTNTFYKIIVVGIVINPLITVVTQRMYRQHVVKYGRQIGCLLKKAVPFNVCFCRCTKTEDSAQKNGMTDSSVGSRQTKNSRAPTIRQPSHSTGPNYKCSGGEESRLTTISEF
ncbi:hypothetical protein M3Y95_00007800 [Aphelenchoides besseyi]|nr:hypothetical protein M3Y95_00007800 [Aphelenchoides besseyi]